MKNILNYLNEHPLKFLAITGFIVLMGLEIAFPSASTGAAQVRYFTPEQRALFAVWINADGYDCANAYGADQFLDGPIKVSCRGSGGEYYLFGIQNHGGKWSISVY